MDIKHQDDGKRGAFFIEENGENVAEMTYVWSGEDKIIIDHTGVSTALSGKGVGQQLVSKAVDMARGQHIKILPLCPFAKRVFEKVEDYRDVLF